MSYATPWAGQLDPGTYEVAVPPAVQVGGDIYNFMSWEDGSTSLTRTINLTVDTTITAYYVAVPPPPPGQGTLEVHTHEVMTRIMSLPARTGLLGAWQFPLISSIRQFIQRLPRLRRVPSQRTEVNATVEVVGVGTYTTPFTINLPVGTHTLNATYKTYTVQTKTVDITEGATSPVNFDFAA